MKHAQQVSRESTGPITVFPKRAQLHAPDAHRFTKPSAPAHCALSNVGGER